MTPPDSEALAVERQLSRHLVECAKSTGELKKEIAVLRREIERNLKLLYVLLGGMLAVAARSFWPALFGG